MVNGRRSSRVNEREYELQQEADRVKRKFNAFRKLIEGHQDFNGDKKLLEFLRNPHFRREEV